MRRTVRVGERSVGKGMGDKGIDALDREVVDHAFHGIQPEFPAVCAETFAGALMVESLIQMSGTGTEFAKTPVKKTAAVRTE